ncbi:MAG: hypothetical protein KAJ66_00310 [Candidatus Omnitrophica bacterium]|nr:hypothetical protein [Candidatus Omnitrophota bacterium]
MANIALYSVLPFVVVVFFKGLEGKYSIIKAAALIALASLAGSASGANPPLLLAVIPILFLSFFIYYLYAVKTKTISMSKGLKFFFRYLCLVILPVILINSFWLIPRIGEVFYSVSDSGFSFLSKDDALQWLQGISANSSIWNVARLQGMWTWYQGWKEPYCPYASIFRENIFFLALSCLLPLMVLIGIVTCKNRYKVFFAPLTVLALIFSMGVHAPFANVYLWCVKYVPFFWIIRSPWYKFTLLTCLGYAFFIGVAAVNIYKFINNRKWRLVIFARRALIAGFIIFNMVYAYPVVFGKFFVSPEERKYLPPNHAVIPDYVLEFSKYINSKDEYFRIMDLPDSQYWAYNWGLSGATPFVTQISLKPVLFNIYTQLAGSESKDVTTAFYDVLYNKGFPAVKLLNILNASYVLQENDVNYIIPDNGIDSPEFVKERLSRQREIKLEKKFGNWDLYKADVDLPYIYIKNKATLIKGGLGVLAALTNTNLLDQPLLIFEERLNKELRKEFFENSMFSEVVFYNYDFETGDNSFIDIQENSLNYFIFLDSSRMNVGFVNKTEGRQKQITIKYNTGFFDETVTFDDENAWYVLSENNKEHIIINNTSVSPQKINLAFNAHAFGRDRNLYVYINNEYINFFPVVNEESKQIILENMLLQPGENILSFANVAASDNYDGKLVSFAIKDDAALGKFTFNKPIDLAEEGEYSIRLYPYPLETYDTLPEQYEISINGDSIKLEKHRKDNTIVYSKKTNLKSGIQVVKIEQVNSGENYVISICPLDNKRDNSRVSKVNFEKINPTEHKVFVDKPDSYFLVFNESYHSQWRAIEASGDELTNHFVVNGYANGWYVDKIKSQELTIQYKPQILFIIGCIISIITFCTLLCLPMIISKVERGHESN